MLLNDDVMTAVTIRKDGSAFIGWELNLTSNEHYFEHKTNYFTKRDGDLHVLSYRSVGAVVEQFSDYLQESGYYGG